MLLEGVEALRYLVLGEDEVVLLEIVDGVAVAVLHDDVDDDQLGAGLKDAGASRTRRGCGLLLGVGQKRGGGEQCGAEKKKVCAHANA